jgi:hypothetical protein
MAVTPGGGKMEVIDEMSLVKPNQEAIFSQSDMWSRRSSETVPITTAEEYELHNLRTLKRHGYHPSKSSTLGSWSYAQPTRNMDMLQEVSPSTVQRPI